MLGDENTVPSKIEREDVPLKSSNQNQQSSCEEYLSGSKFINISFGTLTIIITIALLLQIYYGDYQVVPHGSVATDSLECSEIGTGVLKKGGNSVDAAIASTFCLSVFAPHLTGLDADGQMLIYNHRSKVSSILVDFSNLSISTDIPRLVLGLAYCHRKFGKLSWKELVQPSIKFAREGFLVSKALIQAIQLKKANDLFGRLEISQLIRIEKLADTLQNIARLSEKQLDTFVTPENSPIESEAYSFEFRNYEIFVPNFPSIGPILSIMLNEIGKQNSTREPNAEIKKIVEIMRIVNQDFQLAYKFHSGVSSNVAAVDKDDVYVSMITGLSSLFGSGEMTSSGYIMNSKNDLKSTRFPIIIVDSHHNCGRRMIFGANDIILATQVVHSLLISGENSTESIENPRFHMSPFGLLGLEKSHYPYFSKEAEQLFQALSSNKLQVDEPYDSINVVEKFGDSLTSHSDSRGGGIASRFRRAA